MSPDRPAATPPPGDHLCPWCPYAGTLKQVLMHMESRHYQRWCDLALFPLVAGGVY
jgi:hypothetical protein